MKKKVTILSILFLSLLIFTGCGGNNPEKKGDIDSQADKKTVTVTTTFLEDMVHVLAKDKVHVELIIPAGEDPHL